MDTPNKTPTKTPKYDPKIVDDYIKHLIDVSKQKRCVATEDIYNSFGVLLVKEGEEVTASHGEKLNNHHLENDIDGTLKLEDALNERTLLKSFLEFIESKPHLLKLHDRNNFEKALEHLCNGQNRHHTMLQKLTVLKIQFPKEFEQTLFCAWLAALIAKKANHTNGIVTACFIGGLYSNLGVLHLPKETMEAPEDNSISYQTHPIISSLIAKATKLHDKETLQATMEHHEALYGEGYPHSKNMATMCKAGLCLSTANFVYQLSAVLPLAQQFNLNIGLPHMRIHNALNSNPIFTAAHQVIASAKLPPLWESLGLDPNAYNEFLLDKTLSICELSAAIGFVNKLFTSLEKTNTNLAIIIRLQRTIKSLHSTGLSSLDVVEMLCEEENQISLDEMIDMDLMQAEFFYGAEFLLLQLKRFSQSDSLAEDMRKACEEQANIMDELFHSHEAKTFLHQLASEREQEAKQNEEASIANALGNQDSASEETPTDEQVQKQKAD